MNYLLSVRFRSIGPQTPTGVEREITLAEVAEVPESLELTRLQCSRLMKRFHDFGAAGMINL